MTLMKYSSAMLGNSSAGVREACVFGTPTLNIGSRQTGRKTPLNVTNVVHPTKQQVVDWVSSEMHNVYPPSEMYGFRDSSKRIADFIATCDLESCRRKSFYEPEYSFLPPPTCPRERLNHDECGGQLKVLALITARGGSKGIPHKNIVELNGKPLIQYTIDAALGSKSLDRVILSTDCEEISTVAKSLGCEVPFIRPSELAQDNSTHRSAVIHALDYLREKEGYVPDYLLLLQPTSPFRTSEDIDNAVSLMERSQCDLVVSVCSKSGNLSKFSYVDKHGCLHLFAVPTVEKNTFGDRIYHAHMQRMARSFCKELRLCDTRLFTYLILAHSSHQISRRMSCQRNAPWTLTLLLTCTSHDCSCKHLSSESNTNCDDVDCAKNT